MKNEVNRALAAKKAIFINGSPRKNKNTAQMLEAAMKGAQD